MTTTKELVFTQTSGTGTYKGSVTIPAYAVLLDIFVLYETVWTTSGQTTFKVGDVSDEDSYWASELQDENYLDVANGVSGNKTRWTHTGGTSPSHSLDISPLDRDIIVTVHDDDANGVTGVTRFLFVYAIADAGHSNSAVKL